VTMRPSSTPTCTLQASGQSCGQTLVRVCVMAVTDGKCGAEGPGRRPAHLRAGPVPGSIAAASGPHKRAEWERS